MPTVTAIPKLIPIFVLIVLIIFGNLRRQLTTIAGLAVLFFHLFLLGRSLPLASIKGSVDFCGFLVNVSFLWLARDESACMGR